MAENDQEGCGPDLETGQWGSSHALEKTGNGMIIIDRHGMIRFANRAAERTLGISPGEELVAVKAVVSAGTATVRDEASPAAPNSSDGPTAADTACEAFEPPAPAYETILGSIGDGIAVIDARFRFTYQNRASKERIGDRIGDFCHVALAGSDTVCEDCYLDSCLASGTSATTEKCYDNNGAPVHFEITVSPLRDAQGTVIAGVMVFREIGERKRMEEHLRFISKHDVLTGLYNRSCFEQELASLESGDRFPVTVIMADVDELKAINDRLGHAAGDVLLRQAAALFRDAFRSEDVVARVGGDEFAVLLPDTDEFAARKVVARIRDNLAVWNDSNPESVELSIGVAVAACGEALFEAKNLADQRMYDDKVNRTGRPPRRGV